MAKELPYFKFEPSEWDNGNIQLCSREEKGLYIDICSMYWSRLGDVSEKLIVQKLCLGKKSMLNNLISEEIIEIQDGKIYIEFLDEQLEEVHSLSKKNSENAQKRWEKIPERIPGDLVYVIFCWNDDEEFIKIGETKSSINRRFSGKMPYNFKALIVDIDWSLDLESHYSQSIKDIKNYEYSPKIAFSGKLECYKVSAYTFLKEFAIRRNARYIFRNPIRREEKREEEKKEDDSSLKKNQKKKFNFKQELIDFGFKKKLVEDWLTVRKNKKATNSETAWKRFKPKFESMLEDKNDVLEMIIEKSWAGFEPSWYYNEITKREEEQNSNRNSKNKPSSIR